MKLPSPPAPRPSAQRLDPRVRRRRVGVVALLVAIVVLNVVPAARQAAGGFVGGGVRALVEAATGRDEEVDRLTRENVAANERARRAEQSLAARQTSTQLARRFGGPERSVVVGRVITFTPAPATSAERKVELDAGTRDGITLSQPVVATSGLVGRVTSVRADSCTVTLLADSSSVVGARIERSKALARLTGAAPAGSVRRTGQDVGLTIAPGGSVKEGDTVVTAGSPGDLPYPPGLPIGRVSRVDADRGQSERVAAVTPFVSLGALDVVAVLVPKGR